jgi:hypothetical protein
VAESGGLLNRCTGKTVPGVRIPPSPPELIPACVCNGFEWFISMEDQTNYMHFQSVWPKKRSIAHLYSMDWLSSETRVELRRHESDFRSWCQT